MRLMILTITAVTAVSSASVTPTFAARNQAVLSQSVTEAFNACVALAKERGFSAQDLDGSGNRAAAKKFVMDCMRGKQR